MGDLIDVSCALAREIRDADQGRANEASIEDTIVAEAEAAGWFVRKLTYPGRKGAPDRMFIKDGRVVFIEFKRAGASVKGFQAAEGRRILRAGGEWLGCSSLAQARALLEL